MTHEIKILPKYFEKAKDWSKPFELRKDDRPYQLGDIVILKEFSYSEGIYTGRQAARSHVDDVPYIKDHPNVGLLWKAWIESLPSAQPEQLTDKEQRIFLAAMGREEKVCKQVDDECRDCREPYEDSLVRVCHEIIRKVKAAL